MNLFRRIHLIKTRGIPAVGNDLDNFTIQDWRLRTVVFNPVSKLSGIPVYHVW